jgi:hypothetical protein
MAAAAQVAPCVSLAVSQPPPALPYYQQPPAPAANSMWEPGYWAWGPVGYYWVPGTWVPAPVVGVYWTPGYWAFAGSGWIWSPGFWGPSVGFYGGINYGFGFFGVGFVGGVWAGSTFAYNTAVTNVNTRIVRNVFFNRVVVRHGTIVARGRVVGGGTRVRSGTVVGRGTVDRHGTIRGSRVAFNGGHGGISARPTAAQHAIASGKRLGSTSVQRGHVAAAAQNRNNLVAFNHGRPPVTTTRTPITSANRQPDFKPLSTQDRTVAQNQALSKMRVMGGSASGRVVAAAHAGSGSRVSQGSSGYHSTSGASRSYGGSHGYSGSRSYEGQTYHAASHGYQGYGGHQAGGFGGGHQAGGFGGGHQAGGFGGGHQGGGFGGGHGGGGHGPPRP